MDLWYTEFQTPNLGFSCKVKETLWRVQTAYQELAVLDTFQFGKMLVLDGMVQTTDIDEFVYHEMIAHVPMRIHPNPTDVLVIGGGDGGAIREVCKYPSLKRATLVEIDDQVVQASRRFFPQISSSLTDPRVEIVHADGVEYIRSFHETFDVVIVDSTEPVGPAKSLFQAPFYQAVFSALKPDGLMVAQTESPFINADLIRSVQAHIQSVFPDTYLYLASIPTYPSGLWSFSLGSRQYNPLFPENRFVPQDTRYYTLDIHQGSFSLPLFVSDLITVDSSPGI